MANPQPSGYSRAQLAAGARRRLLALGAALVTTVAAAGCANSFSAAADPPPSTLGSAQLAPHEVAQPDSLQSTRLRASERSDPNPVGEPVAAGASLPDIVAAVASAHGPTDDPMAQIARFGPVPELGSLPGTEIIDLRADSRNAAEGTATLATVEATMLIDGDMPTVAQFYRDEAGRLGWTLRTSHSTGPPNETLAYSYAIPGNAFQLDDFSIELRSVDPIGPANPAQTLVSIRAVTVEPAGAATTRLRYDAWVPDVTLPGPFVTTGAGFQSTAIGRISLHLTFTALYEGTTAEALSLRLTQALEQASITPVAVPRFGDLMDTWLYVEHDSFDEWRFAIHDVTNPDTGLITGATLNVEARISPRPDQPNGPAAGSRDGG